MRTFQISRVDRAAVASQQGLTLVEVLVVLVIMALLVSVVMVSIGGERDRAEDLSQELRQKLVEMSDAAVLSNKAFGAQLEPQQILFLRYEDGEWQEASAPLSLGENVRVVLELTDSFPFDEIERDDIALFQSEEESEIAPQPDIVFNPVGESTGFSLTIREAGNGYRVEKTPLGKVEVNRVEG